MPKKLPLCKNGSGLLGSNVNAQVHAVFVQGRREYLRIYAMLFGEHAANGQGKLGQGIALRGLLVLVRCGRRGVLWLGGRVGHGGRGGVNGCFVGTVVDGGDDENDGDREKNDDGRKVNRAVYANLLELFEELRFLPVLLHFDTPLV